MLASHLGIEPRTFGLEVQRAILCANGSCWHKMFLAERSFDLRTSGLWAQHASTAPLCYPCDAWAGCLTGKEFHSYCGQEAKVLFVSCEIRTHAHRSGLRPERSALDHSAKLTVVPNHWQPQPTSYANDLLNTQHPSKVLCRLCLLRPVSSVG